MAEKTSIMDRVLNVAEQFALPAAQKLIFGGERASDSDLAFEAARVNRINGSGSPDEAGALRNPRSVKERVNDNPLATAFTSSNAGMIALVVVGILAVVYFAKKL